MNNRGIEWNENQISQLRELYSKGFVIDEISKLIDRSHSAVSHKLKDLGLTGIRRVLWTDEDIKQLKDLFDKGLSYPEIAEELGKTVRACQGKAIHLGLKKKDCNVWLTNSRSDFWTDSEIETLKKCISDGLFMKDIVIKMKRSEKSIYAKMKLLNFHLKERTDEEKSLYRRVYSVDDNYFESIDTQKKAYWLGWMVTDGYVITKLNTKRGVTNVNAIGLDLQESDLSVLEELKKDIKTDVSIKYCKTKKPSKPYTNKITKEERWIVGNPQYSLRFSSAKMIQDLAKYGIHQNKTYDIGFPKALDSKFYSGFIAGVISGDGCIDIKKNRKGFILRCTIAGNLDLVQNIHSILAKEIGVNADKTISKYKGSAQLYRLELNQTETINLYKWFNQNGVKLMERKNKMIEDYLADKEFKAA